MFHLGQKIYVNGKPMIYGGVDFTIGTKSRGILFIGKDRTHRWLVTTNGLGIHPDTDKDGEIVVGKFCKELDLYGYFFGILKVETFTDAEWALVEETLNDNKVLVEG